MELKNNGAVHVYVRPWIETEEISPSLLICDSSLDGGLVDVVDEPMI
jgi:hypothetical protein